MSIIGVEFKGFCAGRSDEAISMSMEKPVLVVAKDRKEGTCLDGLEMGLIERKPLEVTSNYSSREENHSGSTMEKEVQQITKLELKRIDPSLRSKRTGLEEEDYPQAKDESHSEADMQVEQEGELLSPSN